MRFSTSEMRVIKTLRSWGVYPQCQQKAAVPTTYTATGPCQVWSWDITWLPSVVRGRWYYLY
ncbi:IS3 family transposase, partial [Tatumella sp. JGM100]|nr:IS3 family transposase [Tatumella sp. JGM82]MBS0902348.1 IS3 family transposase [Tatumella sp. JGM100]